jgi:hypothetical protein
MYTQEQINEANQYFDNLSDRRDKWVAKVEAVKSFIVENGVCDDEPRIGYSNANGNSAYCMWYYNGEYYKVRISDHEALRSGEIKCVSEDDAIEWVHRNLVDRSAWEMQKVYSIERGEFDRSEEQIQECDVVLSTRLSKKGNTIYRVLAPKFSYRVWVRIK